MPEYNYTGQLPNVEDEGYRQHQLYEQHQQQRQQLQHGAQQSSSHLHHGSQQFFQQQQQSDLLSSPVAHVGSQSQFGGPQQISFDASLQQPLMMNVESMQNLNSHNIASYQQSQHHLIQQPQHHHHHQLPESSRPRLLSRSGESDDNSNVPSVVGQPGMPPPAPRPRGPKLKFTSEDDALLIDLKENKALSWKQIAEFFPGRSSGTLQVRYCTKLKAKETLWTDDSVSQHFLKTLLRGF